MADATLLAARLGYAVKCRATTGNARGNRFKHRQRKKLMMMKKVYVDPA